MTIELGALLQLVGMMIVGGVIYGNTNSNMKALGREVGQIRRELATFRGFADKHTNFHLMHCDKCKRVDCSDAASAVIASVADDNEQHFLP
jgi:hypothetical protein